MTYCTFRLLSASSNFLRFLDSFSFFVSSDALRLRDILFVFLFFHNNIKTSVHTCKTAKLNNDDDGTQRKQKNRPEKRTSFFLLFAFFWSAGLRHSSFARSLVHSLTAKAMDIVQHRNTFTSLIRFFKSPEKTNKNDLSCPFCPSTLSNFHVYQRHLLQKHRGIHIRKHKKKTCNWCGEFSTVSSQLMKKHMMNNHEVQVAGPCEKKYYTYRPPSFECPHEHCPFRCYNKLALTFHQKRVHECDNDNRAFDKWRETYLFTTCGVCKKTFENQSYLNHVKEPVNCHPNK